MVGGECECVERLRETPNDDHTSRRFDSGPGTCTHI